MVDLETAMKGKTQLYPEAPGNLCVDWPGPVADEQNERDVADIIAKAPHVARVSVTNQRMVVASLETRGATGVYDAAKTTATRCTPARRAPIRCAAMGAAIMGVPNDKLRVITEDVGGAFGMKTHGLSGISGAAGGGAQARPAGALAIDALGGLRHRHQARDTVYACRAGARRQGQIPSACACGTCATRAPM